ncbi:MAG: peptide/nickel transport system permease protein [Thermomicrobiales bacterium]|nr:peptide/nickel transport system permease protein [Thermomicrobiales bacterium]
MGLWGYIGRRLALAVVVMAIVSVGTFGLAHAVPGNPVDVLIGERQAGDPAARAAVEKRWGFDKPLPVQFVYYVRNLFSGDLGTSVTTRRPVVTDLRQFVPATFELAIAAMIYAVAVGVPLGLVAAIRINRWPDHLSRFAALLGTSLPVFWLGLLMLYVFFYRLRWLPGPGQLDAGMERPDRVTGMITVDSILARDWAALGSAAQHLLLPAIVLGSYAMGIVARMLRSSLLAALSDDYVRTARAKGLAERGVVAGHALRNALIPTVTVLGLTFASLLTGAVLTETIFSWPGIGRYGVQAALKLDYPGLFGVTLVVALAYVLVNLLVDVLYGVLDPRIRVS